MSEIGCGGLAYLYSELRTELRNLVREQRSVVASAGDGYVAEAAIEQVWVTDVSAWMSTHSAVSPWELNGNASGN